MQIASPAAHTAWPSPPPPAALPGNESAQPQQPAPSPQAPASPDAGGSSLRHLPLPPSAWHLQPGGPAPAPKSTAPFASPSPGANGSHSQAHAPAFPKTATAQAAAEVATEVTAPAEPAAPAPPKADPAEIQALELMLADPVSRELVQNFGGELQPLPTWTTVGQGIEARYGQDLGSRLYQLQNAQRAVEGEFYSAMDQALQNPPKERAPYQRRGEPEPTSSQPGWVYERGENGGEGLAQPGWKFDPGAFARHYAAGDSPAQKAFASLHGSDPVRKPPPSNREFDLPPAWELAGLRLRIGRRYGGHEEGLTPESSFVDKSGWVQSGAWRPDHHLDPNRITKLNDKEFVWFDPAHGFVTDSDNLKGDWLDRAAPYLFSAAITAMTFGAGSTVSAGITSAVGTGTAGQVAIGASMAFVGNSSLQLAATGTINFGQLARATLSGGVTAGLLSVTGLDQAAQGSFSQRLMQHTGRATLQGAVQSVMGGKFKDGFINSMMSSVAGEVSTALNQNIDHLQSTGRLSEAQASTMRLLARATGSALRLVGSNDPSAGFASDFLGSLMADGLAEHQPLDVGDLSVGDQPFSDSDPLSGITPEEAQARAVRIAAVERELLWEMLAEEAREASLFDADMLTPTGGRGGGRPPPPVVMVRNGNWDSALNIASDPIGLLTNMQGLQADLGKLDRINAEKQLNAVRQQMRDAGMSNVPTKNMQALVAGGKIVTDYEATLNDLQRRYEDFRRDRRLRDSWGDDYKNIRIGRQRMTVQEFERVMFDVQQRTIDTAFERGKMLLAEKSCRSK